LPCFRTAQLLIKRTLDVVLPLALLLSLAPVLAAVALVVWLGSPGPILYRQERTGKDGRRFRLYKFRTMLANSDPAIHEAYYGRLVTGQAEAFDGTFKLARDPRITRAGRVLRRFSLDELPQLWNVLKGDMSLVGPRPPIPYEVQLYGARERRRLSVVPGLTGLWQVSGRNSLGFQDMIDLDLEYIERWSIWLDLAIILRTPLVLLSGQGAC
jgi:lipopolysaccharide/colanic/teichoic acid biosynthesis glycosyltransferase